MKYNEVIFSNGTFYIASKFSYQVEIDVKDLNGFYTALFFFFDT